MKPDTAPKLNQQQLDKISQQTIADYNDRAQWFHEHTRDHDVSQNLAALIRHINRPGSSRLLDFGCGPGRDLKTLTAAGHQAIGLDGCENFCTMARVNSGCEVWQQNFLQLDLPNLYFDGIFANATLFHVPGQELPRVLNELNNSLKPGGVLLSSNPHGQNEEGFSRRPHN